MFESRRSVILVADDDCDDCLLLKEAAQEAQVPAELHFVHNGEVLLDYLYRRGRYAPPNEPPSPDLLFLDLNMPKKDGREVLRSIKEDPELRRIPVIVFTTSRAEEDVTFTYDLGVNSFVVKPNSFSNLITIMQTIEKYWFEIVKLPPMAMEFE